MAKLADEWHRSSSCMCDDCNLLAVVMLQFAVRVQGLRCTPTAGSGLPQLPLRTVWRSLSQGANFAREHC